MTKDELIRENTELHARLALAEKWMRREVQSAIRLAQEKSVKKSTRKSINSVFEEEGIDIMTTRILSLFGEHLKYAPKFTLERLIDAEIYYETLQRYPTMDGLPIVLAYQKILDAWIEESLIRDWRKRNTDIRLSKLQNHNDDRYELWIERDLQNVIARNYSLSIGRLYQILSIVRDQSNQGDQETQISWLLYDLIQFWKNEKGELFHTLISDTFFSPFSLLIDREVFSKKRHESKVTFSDVKVMKEAVLQILSQIFR
jgi:hypothetical protein